MQFIHKKIDYTVPSGFEGGPGMGKQITPYVGTPYIDMTEAQWRAVGQNIGAQLGATWTLGGFAPALGGNSFMFVKTNEALTLGQLVTIRPPTRTVDDAGGAAATAVAGAGTPASPTTTTAICTTNIDNTSFAVPVGVDVDVDNWLFVTSVAGAAATLPQLRRIKHNSSSTTSFYTVSIPDETRPNRPNDSDQFDFTPLAGETIAIIRPYHVVVNDSTTYGGAGITSSPIGVALGTCAAGHYTIIQVRGLASVQAVGNVTALVVNQPAIGAADGVITGIPAATKSIFTAAGTILPQLASVAAGPILLPCYVDFMAC